MTKSSKKEALRMSEEELLRIEQIRKRKKFEKETEWKTKTYIV